MSPSRDDRKVKMSSMRAITYATEVLEDCKKEGTGGYNNFEGNWRLKVSRRRVDDS